MKIVVGSDHAGFPMKAEILAFLRGLGHEIEDVGSYDPAPVDFPDVARKVAAALDAEGWLVGRQQEPDGIHLHINPIHRDYANEYVETVSRAVAAARDGQGVRIGANERTY